jgi:hypothetical protein
MRRLISYSAIVLALFSCSKNEASLNFQHNPMVEIKAESSKSVNAVPISESGTFPFQSFIWNPCTQEFIYFSGSLHYQLHGMISNNKITYVLHLNSSGVKGLGETSGTSYVSTSTFNYSNTDNFGGQLVYQQSASTNYLALGTAGSFTVINDWHLTVNANGVATFFFTTDGDVTSCK